VQWTENFVSRTVLKQRERVRILIETACSKQNIKKRKLLASNFTSKLQLEISCSKFKIERQPGPSTPLQRVRGSK
jgi:hypothetical protein